MSVSGGIDSSGSRRDHQGPQNGSTGDRSVCAGQCIADDRRIGIPRYRQSTQLLRVSDLRSVWRRRNTEKYWDLRGSVPTVPVFTSFPLSTALISGDGGDLVMEDVDIGNSLGRHRVRGLLDGGTVKIVNSEICG